MYVRKEKTSVYSPQSNDRLGFFVTKIKKTSIKHAGEGILLLYTKNNYNKMNKQELYESMKTLWESFDTNHHATTKAGAGRARKAAGELKKLVTDYRKASVSEDKA